MKIVHRYVLAEAAPVFGLGLLAFSLVVLLQRLARLADLLFARGVPPALAGRLLLALGPAFLEIALPAALLLSVLLALARMGAESETTALRAAGLGMVRGALPPVALLCAATAAASLYVGAVAIPWGHRETRETLSRIAALRAGAAAEEHVFAEAAPGLLLFPDRVSADGTRLEGIFIFWHTKEGEQLFVFAGEGRLLPGGKGREGRQAARLALAGGEIHHETRTPRGYRRALFRTMDLALPAPGAAPSDPADPKGLSYAALLRRAREAQGTDAAVSARFHFHRRLALALSSFPFGFLAIPVGFAQRARRRSSAFGIAMAMVTAFYLFRAAGGALELSAPRLSLLLVWLPDALGLAAAAFLLWRDERGGRAGAPEAEP